MYLNIIEATHDKPTGNNVLNNERLTAFLLILRMILGTLKMSTVYTIIQHSTRSNNQRNWVKKQ